MLQKKETISRSNLLLIWVLGLAGQLCWNVENQWFNTFVYAKIGPYPWIISWMTAVSAAVTTFSTFWFGTLSDRKGKRKPFVCIGYIMWGVFTIAFGLAEFLPKNRVVAAAVTVVAKLPATTFNAVVALIGAPILAIAISKALEKSHLTLE